MALTLDDFLTDYFEFAETDPTLVERAIAQAAREVDATVWGTHTDDGVALLAAHYLRIRSRGSNKPLKPGETTEFKDAFDRLQLIVTAGFGPSGC